MPRKEGLVLLFEGPLAEGSTQRPGGDGTWNGVWVQGCCQGQRH